jgi:hypothetical protein
MLTYIRAPPAIVGASRFYHRLAPRLKDKR